MKHKIIIILSVLAISLTGFSQTELKEFHLKSKGEEVSQIKPINFNLDKGSIITINLEVKWNPQEDGFTMIFHNDKNENGGRYIYFFPKMKKMGKIKKEDNTLWFDKSLKKYKAVFAYHDNKDENTEEYPIRVFDLGEKEIFDLPKFKKNIDTLYAYIADNIPKGKRDKRVNCRNVVPFKITQEKIIDPCMDAYQSIKDIQNKILIEEESLKKLIAETNGLSNLSCQDLKNKELKQQKDTNETKISFPNCDEFTIAEHNFNISITNYNKEIQPYNIKLHKEIENKCPICCCKSNSLKTINDELTTIYFEAKKQNKDINSLTNRFKKVKSISCNDCEKCCPKEYKEYKRLCKDISDLLGM